MKKRHRRNVAICVVLFVHVLVFEMKYSLMLRFSLRHTHRKNSQETEWLDMIQLELNTSKHGSIPSLATLAPPSREINCDRSHYAYDICTIHVGLVLDPTTSTFFIQHPTTLDPNPTVTKIRPYPRKFESVTMSKIKELTITLETPIPSCQVKHESPALVFSAGGYTGNFFHDFNGGFIPLFITLNSMFHHQDVVLVISKARDWWVKKYAHLLGQFSKHPIIDLDNDNTTHCFISATLGLVSHGYMTINPELMPNSKSLHHFHAFLSKAYGAKNTLTYSPSQNARPRLVLVNRSSGDGRLLLNLEEVILIMKNVGFDVIVFEPKSSTPLNKAFALISSSHAMVGIHGAAPTHLLFLKPGSSFIQVVPLGAEWAAEVCYGNPAKAMGLNYIEYRINVEESSLIEKYGKEDMMIKDPIAFLNGKWSKRTMEIYLKEQNVRLDLVRFRKYLKEAYVKAKQLISKGGRQIHAWELEKTF